MKNPTENEKIIDSEETPGENTQMAEGATPPEPGAAATAPVVSILTLADGGVNSATVTLPTNADGTVKRRPGRPRKNPLPDTANASTQSASPAVPSTPKTTVQKKATKAATIGMASTVLNTIQAGMCNLVGNEWAFQNQDEADTLRNSLVNFIEAKGGAEMTPEMDLIFTTAAYAFPRFGHENTRSKMSKFFGGLWSKVSGLFGK